MVQVKLDVDLISEECYKAILKELRKTFGEGEYDEWTISAETEGTKCECMAVEVDNEYIGLCANCQNIL